MSIYIQFFSTPKLIFMGASDPGQGNTDEVAVHENHPEGEEISRFEWQDESSLRLRGLCYVDVVL